MRHIYIVAPNGHVIYMGGASLTNEELERYFNTWVRKGFQFLVDEL